MKVATTNSKCTVTMGAKDGNKATSSATGLAVVKNMMYFLGGTNIVSMQDANLGKLCEDVYARQRSGGACGQTFNIVRKSNGDVMVQPTLNCRGKPAMFVSMTLCVKPCMNDASVVCCLKLGWIFLRA